MVRIFTFIFIISLSLTTGNISSAQSPKREMRSSWLTTVWGLDWPGTKIPAGGGEQYINQQKQQLVRILDSMKVAGTNAVFFQVRPECDAFYNSSYEPWSAHLVERRGQDPGYDPLEFAVEECHKRGLELHAWLNPYRFESVAGKYSGQAGDYKQTHPEWVLTYANGGSILDPGNPEVRERISDIVNEIISNYNVDGIVFDDYFYAYGGTPVTLDQYSQDNWKPVDMNLHDWRRRNVNQMVAAVYETIQQNKPWVTFGVSPFGIWTVDPLVAASYGLTLPQGITGMDAYKVIYCDPLAWLQEGTVDYVSPQIYWPTTSVGQDYKKLAPWWSDVVNRYNRHLYVSHSLTSLDEADYPPPVALKSAYADFLQNKLQGLSMMEYYSKMASESSIAGYDPSEYGLQIQWNRNSDKNQAPGSVFFRSTFINRKGFINYLRTHEYQYLALPPVKAWKQKEPRALPGNLRIENEMLLWDSDETNVRYSVYAIPQAEVNEQGNFTDGRYLLGMIYASQLDLSPYKSLADDHVFAVAVFDRNGNEFPPVVMGIEPAANQPTALLEPADGQDVISGFLFSWEQVANAEYYILEVAADAHFTDVLFRRNVTDTSFPSGDFSLKNNAPYYWRVLTRMSGVDDVASEVSSFTKLNPQIIYPSNQLTDVELTPVLQWEPFDEGYTFRIQISTNSQFTGVVYDEQDISGTAIELPAGSIYTYSTYYMRIKAAKEEMSTDWSDVITFSTIKLPPAVPEIISPAEGESIAGPEVKVTVENEPLAKSITFQISNSATFPWNSRIQHTVNAPSGELVLNNLDDGTWYVKARANYGSSSYTEWSDVVSFHMLTTTSATTARMQIILEAPTVIPDKMMQIRYILPEQTFAIIYITDVTGKRIVLSGKTIHFQGEHFLRINGSAFKKGIYFLTLETNGGKKTIKLIK
jgi:uncharacterized lipoprotein YddW (UPF0748 family)